MATMLVIFAQFRANAQNQACPTFLLVRAHLRENSYCEPPLRKKKLLWATSIFTKIKLQIIPSLLYKIGAEFDQYFRNLS